jgi:hypothetical protein
VALASSWAKAGKDSRDSKDSRDTKESRLISDLLRNGLREVILAHSGKG